MEIAMKIDDEYVLPCDFIVAAEICFGKGTKLEIVRDAAERWLLRAAENPHADVSGQTVAEMLIKGGREDLAYQTVFVECGWGVFWKEKGQSCSVLKSSEKDAINFADRLDRAASVEPVYRRIKRRLGSQLREPPPWAIF
jgi:hypothetical protein